jgi:hypothetical protein
MISQRHATRGQRQSANASPPNLGYFFFEDRAERIPPSRKDTGTMWRAGEEIASSQRTLLPQEQGTMSPSGMISQRHATHGAGNPLRGRCCSAEQKRNNSFPGKRLRRLVAPKQPMAACPAGCYAKAASARRREAVPTGYPPGTMCCAMLDGALLRDIKMSRSERKSCNDFQQTPSPRNHYKTNVLICQTGVCLGKDS